MALDYRPVSLPLSGGLDTKSDPRVLEMPRLEVCENAIFDETGGIQTRDGFSAFTTDKDVSATAIDMDRARALGKRDDELLLFAEGRCYSYAEAEDRWADRGRFESVLVDQEAIYPDRTGQQLGDRAELSGVVLYCWYDTANNGIRYICTDKETGAIYESTFETFISGKNRARAIATSTHLQLWYLDGANLKVVSIDPADVTGTINSGATTVASNAGTVFDVKKKGNNAVVVFNTNASPPLYEVHEVAGDGTTNQSSAKARNAHVGVAISHHATEQRLAVVRIDQAGGNDDVKLDWMRDDLVDQTVNVAVDTDGLNTVRSTTVVVLAGPIAFAFWDTVEAGSPEFDIVRRGRVTAAGAVTKRFLAVQSMLGSHAFLWDDGGTERPLVHLLHDSNQQPLYVLVDGNFTVSDTSRVRTISDEVAMLAVVLPREAGGQLTLKYHLPQIDQLGANQFACLLVRRSRLLALGGDKYSERQLRDTVYTFADSRAFVGVQEGKATYLPGGYPAMYDGKRVAEANPVLYPEEFILTAGSGSGSMAEGEYGYIFVWERYNAQGERVQSSYAGSQTGTIGVGSGNTRIACQANALPYTNDDRWVLAAFRTEVNPGPDAPYYRVTSLDPSAATFVLNNPTQDYLSFTDLLDDASIVDEEAFDLDEVNTNMPEPTLAVASGQRRVFIVDPEDKNIVDFSKQRLRGDGIEWHDGFSIETPRDAGDIKAIDAVDGGVFIFTERAVYLATGDGPNNVGDGSYPIPSRIVSNIGCIDPRSVVRTPKGVMFRSHKGVYLLDHAYQIHYVGAGIEAYNSENLVGASDVLDNRQLVMLGDTTGVFMFDYQSGEWSIWKSSAGVEGKSMVELDGNIYVLQDDGILKSGAGAYQDGTTEYDLVAETGWIRLQGILGFGKVRRIGVLGETVAEHRLRLRIAYDDDPSWITDRAWQVTNPTGYSAAYVARSDVQAARSVKVRIDVKGGMKLTGLTMEMGFRRAMARLPHGHRE